jgi:putative two-component system response regulator
LRGDQVPLLAQIVGIVDVYDALTSERPYRPPLTPDAALRHLLVEVEQERFSRTLVTAFMDTVDKTQDAITHPGYASRGAGRDGAYRLK